MPATYIHQIFYSPETRRSLDPGFIALDNLRNERPDWREYWPIRRFLQETTLDETAFYGFFSPKFGKKTGLSSAVVNQFVAEHENNADVMLFSPFFDQCAFFLNICRQGEAQHPGLLEILRECATLLAPAIDVDNFVTHSGNTVFCNFFVAKPAFWSVWLNQCETIFEIAEKDLGDLAKKLNSKSEHTTDEGAPAKVFVIERIATLILAGNKNWRVRSFNPLSLPCMSAGPSEFAHELAAMDAFKFSLSTLEYPEYRNIFFGIRTWITQTLEKRQSG